MIDRFLQTSASSSTTRSLVFGLSIAYLGAGIKPHPDPQCPITPVLVLVNMAHAKARKPGHGGILAEANRSRAVAPGPSRSEQNCTVLELRAVEYFPYGPPSLSPGHDVRLGNQALFVRE